MNKIITYFIIFIGALYLLWSIILPFNQGPDEYHRYDVANFIYTYKELPIAGDSRLYYGVYGVTYAVNLSLPYLLGSLLMMLSNFFFGIENVYLAHRLISVVSGIFSVYIVYKIGQILKWEKNFLYFFVALFALVPQFSFINSYVNLDSFTVCMIVLIMYLVLKGEEAQWKGIKYFIYLGVAISCLLLSYLNGYVIIPAILVYLLVSVKDKKAFIKKIPIILLIILILVGPLFARNIILYDELFGMKTSTELSEQLAIDELKPSNRPTPFQLGLSLNEMFFDKGWITSSFNSFWAAFGYMSIWLPFYQYHVIGTIVFISLLGLFLGLYNLFKKNKRTSNIEILKQQRFIVMQVVVILLTVFLSAYYSYFSDYQPQGRYLYPAYFSFLYLFTIGIKEIINRKYRNIIYLTLVIYMLYLNFYSLYKLIFIPFYS